MMGQVFILLIDQAMGIKSNDHHLLCTMQCGMNGVVINKVSDVECTWNISLTPHKFFIFTFQHTYKFL